MARKRCVLFSRIQSFLGLQTATLKPSILAGMRRQNKRLVRPVMLFMLFFAIAILPVAAQLPSQPTQQAQLNPTELVKQGKASYDQGQYKEAIQALEQAEAALEKSGDSLQQAMVLSNLSLAQQQQGEWTQAEKAINQSLALLRAKPGNPTQQQLKLLAAALEVQGKLQLEIGRPEDALETWQEATRHFEQVSDRPGIARTQIHQSLALQELGQYRQALKALLTATEFVTDQSLEQAIVYRELGTVLRVVGDLAETEIKALRVALPLLPPDSNQKSEDEYRALQPQSLQRSKLQQSQQLLQQSLFILQNLKASQNKQDVAQTHLELGNTAWVAYQRAEDALRRVSTKYNELPVQLLFLEEAIQHYEAAGIQATHSVTSIQAQLNLLRLLVDFKQRLPEIEKNISVNSVNKAKVEAWSKQLEELLSPNQLEKLHAQIEQLPIDRTSLYTRINLAQSLIKQAASAKTPADFAQNSALIESLLQATIQASGDRLPDRRIASFALGNLAHFYEVKAQLQGEIALLPKAQDKTQAALKLAEADQAPDIAYLWQWQLGRILKQQAEAKQDPKRWQQAIAAYSEATKSVSQLQRDYLSGLKNPDIAFSFQGNVEPIYRELLELYLPSPAIAKAKQIESNSGASSLFLPGDLSAVVQVFEDLQVLELENYLRCRLQNQLSAPVEQTASEKTLEAAVIYPVLLDDRLEVLLKLPGKDLLRFTTLVTQEEIENTVKALQESIIRSRKNYDKASIDEVNQRNNAPPEAQRLYRWLFEQTNQPTTVKAELEQQQIKTLVFVLGSGSGALKNLPVATLHDGESYLIQKGYRFALNLAPQLLRGKPLTIKRLQLLAAGVYVPNLDPEDNQPYEDDLKGVKRQLNEIENLIPQNKVLRNADFTFNALKATINSEPFAVVHLATHGKVGPGLDDSFVLAYQERIDLERLSQLLYIREGNRPEPIELLVFNACQTAFGDARQALGIAGVAVQSGARSTIASIFDADDESAAALMIAFYKNLLEPGTSVSEALRLAQVELLEGEYFKLYQWSTFVLVGDWR